MLREIISEKGEELLLSVLPAQTREIQEILIKETDSKATIELITLNQQKEGDEILK